MVAQQYPVGVRVFVDDIDITSWAFGEVTINPSELENTWRNIDISSWVKGPGLHTIKVTCEGGVGRCESRVEIS